MSSVGYGDYLYGLRDIKGHECGRARFRKTWTRQTLNFTPTWTEAVQRGDDVGEERHRFYQWRHGDDQRRSDVPAANSHHVRQVGVHHRLVPMGDDVAGQRRRHDAVLQGLRAGL